MVQKNANERIVLRLFNDKMLVCDIAYVIWHYILQSPTLFEHTLQQMYVCMLLTGTCMVKLSSDKFPCYVHWTVRHCDR